MSEEVEERDSESQVDAAHYMRSSFREKLLEHLLVGAILKELWCSRRATVELLRPEVDQGGYDLVLDCGGIVRHVQLKTSHRGAATARQKVNVALGAKPSGCVIWTLFDEESLELGPFRWFGSAAGTALRDLSTFEVAKHTKANAQGVKLERPAIRVLTRADFKEINSISGLVDLLFGSCAAACATPNIGAS